MNEYYIIGGVSVWWTVAVVFFMGLKEIAVDHRELIFASVLWPIFSLFVMLVMLWRIPFKSAKAIRVDLRNRKLIREFDKWLDERDDK